MRQGEQRTGCHDRDQRPDGGAQGSTQNRSDKRTNPDLKTAQPAGRRACEPAGGEVAQDLTARHDGEVKGGQHKICS